MVKIPKVGNKAYINLSDGKIKEEYTVIEVSNNKKRANIKHNTSGEIKSVSLRKDGRWRIVTTSVEVTFKKSLNNKTKKTRKKNYKKRKKEIIKGIKRINNKCELILIDFFEYIGIF